MLSRIAESLFWIGRYLERADDTARLLDVQIHQLLEDATAEQERASSKVLSVMGIRPMSNAQLGLDEVIALLGYSTSQPSSIVSSLRGARDNARGIRETISSEFWECLNATTVAIDVRAASTRATGPHDFFRFAMYVKERVSIATGIADSTMSRDDGWRFLILGRTIERVDMTARLLEVQITDTEETADWATTLRYCSAHEAYLRAHRGILTALSAVDFLLLDPLFPRSVYFALTEAQKCVAELDQPMGQIGPSNEAGRIIGRARASLEYRTIRELVEQLPTYLVELQRACSDATFAIAEHYFQQGATLAWRTDTSSTLGREVSA